MRRRLTIAVAAVLLLTGCSQSPVAGPVRGPATVAATPAPSETASATATPTAQPSAVPTSRATLPPADAAPPPPVRFGSPTIEVDLPVVPVGVAEDGQMQLPETVREVAWYSFGPRPGDREGTTVLAAHVDTRADGLGPFARLRDLRRGDDLAVTDARGREHRYVVTAIEDVEKSDLALTQLFRRDGEPQLKVLTCGGPFSKRTGYRDNVVVSAQPR